VQRWVHDLNAFYRATPALYQLDFSAAGFEWIDCDDSDTSVLTFLRQDGSGNTVLVACNFTPVLRANYRVGVPRGGRWRERLNSDAHDYGGSGQGNLGAVQASAVSAHGRPHSLALRLPPLAVVVLTPD
jgi:1,4-alpha-glucan branching enzyme